MVTSSWKHVHSYKRLNQTAASTTHSPLPEVSVWATLVSAQTAQRQDRKRVPSLTPSRAFLQIRIVGGRSSYEGRVEVKVGSKWGTVCSTGWTTKEAMVVCSQLGLGYAMHAINVSRTSGLNEEICSTIRYRTNLFFKTHISRDA